MGANHSLFNQMFEPIAVLKDQGQIWGFDIWGHTAPVAKVKETKKDTISESYTPVTPDTLFRHPIDKGYFSRNMPCVMVDTHSFPRMEHFKIWSG